MDKQSDTNLDQTDEDVLTDTISDEALEAAAEQEGVQSTFSFFSYQCLVPGRACCFGAKAGSFRSPEWVARSHVSSCPNRSGIRHNSIGRKGPRGRFMAPKTRAASI
jgi:hypothetical protein